MRSFVDQIEGSGCETVFVGDIHINGDEWSFDIAGLVGKTMLHTSMQSKSRARVDMWRDELLDELDARCIEVIEIACANRPSADSSASIALN